MNNTCEELIKQIMNMPGYIVVGDKVVETKEGPFLLRNEVAKLVSDFRPKAEVG